MQQVLKFEFLKLKILEILNFHMRLLHCQFKAADWFLVDTCSVIIPPNLIKTGHHPLRNTSCSLIQSHCHKVQLSKEIKPRRYKTFPMLNSTEYEIPTAHKKLKYRQIKTFLALSLSDIAFIMLINVKMPTILQLLAFEHL